MSYLLSEIQRLDRLVRELDVKKNSLSSQRTILKFIGDLKNEVDKGMKGVDDDS